MSILAVVAILQIYIQRNQIEIGQKCMPLSVMAWPYKNKKSQEVVTTPLSVLESAFATASDHLPISKQRWQSHRQFV